MKKHLLAWYRQRAGARFRQELGKAWKRIRVYALPEPKLRMLDAILADSTCAG